MGVLAPIFTAQYIYYKVVINAICFGNNRDKK